MHTNPRYITTRQQALKAQQKNEFYARIFMALQQQIKTGQTLKKVGGQHA